MVSETSRMIPVTTARENRVPMLLIRDLRMVSFYLNAVKRAIVIQSSILKLDTSHFVIRRAAVKMVVKMVANNAVVRMTL